MALQNSYRNQEPTRTLPERVGQLYYAHGLFCSSHPVLVISIAITVVLLCCYPLLNLPLPGNVPQQLSGNLSHHDFNNSAGDMQTPRWFTGQPLVYVQQVVIKTAVCPWTEDMVLTDAFRAPLAEVFKLLEVVRNYQHENSSKTLSHLCLHVETVKTKSDKKLLLPEYNCLILSPANLWQQNRELFQEDPNLLGTIFNYQNLQKGKISLAEMLFGMNMKDTGIKRYPFRTRQRVLQFAITIFLKDYDMQFLNGLRQKLTAMYPLHQTSSSGMSNGTPPVEVNGSLPDALEVLHVYYPGEFNLQELVPFTMACFILFLYMYFSVRKIELVKSKVGMAFSAVVTVLASLSMTTGLCFFFGLILTLNGKEVFPYLVAIVGLENVLVLTKSVVSTPTHLDVKIRVAQGLSREGWSITKNLLTEVTILTVGLFTFVPAIQEFCIFAIVGLLSDFFLQMFFFSTVLAIDIHRMDLSFDSQHRRIHYNSSNTNNPSLNRSPLRQFRSPTPGNSSKILTRSKSHPRLNGLATTSNYPTNVVAPPLNSPPPLEKIPKRLRLVHFWARTRIFQRAFMVCMIVWISVIVYNSGVMQQLLQMTSELRTQSEIGVNVPRDLKAYYTAAKAAQNPALSAAERAAVLDNIADLKTLHSLIDLEENGGVTARNPVLSKLMKAEMDDQPHPSQSAQDDLARLRHSGFAPWRRLSHHHWPAILSLYNMSVGGQYISILPAIRISHVVPPEVARALRNPEEKAAHFQWQTLAAALDPLDFSDGESGKASFLRSFSRNYLGSDVPFIPSSPMEIFLTGLLCTISVLVLAYMMVVLYRCICSRNYAEWRASWAGEHEETPHGMTQVVMEAVPLILDGHQQEVECLATDGSVVVSSCLGGQVRVWDSLSGEALAVIDRKMYFAALQRTTSGTMACGAEADTEDLPLSDYESGSPPSCGETSADDVRKSDPCLWMPDLRSVINTNFTSQSPGSVPSQPLSLAHNRKNGFDFGNRYREMFRDYQNLCDLDADDDSDVELQKNVQACDLRSDSIESSNEHDFSSSSSSHALQIPKMGKGEFSGYFPVNCVKNVGSNSVLSLRKKHQSSINNVADSDDHLRNIDSEFAGSENGSDVFGFTSTQYCAQTEDSDLHCVNTDYFNEDESARRFSYDMVSYNRSRSQEDQVLPIVCPARNSQRNSVEERSSFESASRTYHGTLLSSSGPSNLCIGEKGQVTTNIPPIWCLDCHENLVVLGCANGRLEFWEGSAGKFKCLFEDGSGVGVTAVKIIGNRVVAAKLSGAVDFLELESYSSQGRPLDWGFTSYRRTHVRTGSAGSLSDWDPKISHDSVEEDIHCIRLNTTKAHQQPITVLDSEGGRVLTGSQDHTLKVFRLEDQLPLYTLHGHSGPISCLFIDRISPMMSGSGSQDGLLCVWDLLTGACMYSIQAHDGSIVALTYSASYVISLGTDERLCVWERFQGHLLNTIQVAHTYCSSMVMLTHNLLITSRQGSLVVWDVRTGDPVRFVKLGHRDRCVFVKQILLLRDSVACDYSNQLRIVRFPLVTDKCD